MILSNLTVQIIGGQDDPIIRSIDSSQIFPAISNLPTSSMTEDPPDLEKEPDVMSPSQKQYLSIFSNTCYIVWIFPLQLPSRVFQFQMNMQAEYQNLI